MPIPMGDKNATAVNDLIQWESWYRSSLTDYYQTAMRMWKLYLSDRPDHRKPWEKTWRANTLQPYPYVIIEGKAVAVADIINASDPLVQAEGIDDDDVDTARGVERLLENTLRTNLWRLRSEGIIREAAIQGTAAVKVVHRKETSRVLKPLDDAGLQAFASQVGEYKRQGVEIPDDPIEYEKARIDYAQQGLVLPPNPARAYTEVTTFEGPSIERVSLFDLRFDPLIEDWTRQRRIIQRIVKTKKWVLDRTGDTPDKLFDPQSVQDAIDGLPEGRFDIWQSEIARMLGLQSAASGFPSFENLVEIWEVYDFDDEEHPYKVVLNRLRVINKDTQGFPHGHGESPVSLILNLPVPGSALGLSELKAPEKLFYELWTLRDLRLDQVTLQSLPIFQRLQELGIGEVSKMLRPGMTIPLPRLDAIRKLDLGNMVHPDTFKEIDTLKFEIDDATGVGNNVRGNPATVGRVSASEAERRFSSAMVRMKASGVRFEEQMRRPLKHCVYDWFQNGPPEILVKIGGTGTDRYAHTVTRDQLGQALEMDFRLRGASQAASKEMQIQQLLQWFGQFGPLIQPHRQLAVAKEAYQLLGLKNRNQVIPDEDLLPPPPPAIDPATGQPMVDPATGQPVPAEQPPAPAQGGEQMMAGDVMPNDASMQTLQPEGNYATMGEEIAGAQ